jgi:HPt (histidine-containing phosphotransfer) domain-containing protein
MSLEQTTSTEPEPAVDFIALLGRCLGNFKMVERVLAMFRETGWSDLNQLEEAVKAGDFAAVAEVSHRFKGAASNVSATGLQETLSRTEKAGRAQDAVELASDLISLRQEWQSFVRFAEVFAPTENASFPGTVKQSQNSTEAQHACAGC